MFASFSLFQGNGFAYGLSLLGVLPLWFYARYRARRYVLARTRWRGPALRARTRRLGLCGPRALALGADAADRRAALAAHDLHLEKYRTDRTSFGSAMMVQGGRWQMLYPATKPLFVALAFALGSGTAAFFGNVPVSTGLAILAGLIALYGLVHYRVNSLRRLTATKTLNGVGLSLTASPLRVLMILLLGYFLAALAVAVPATVLGVLIVMLQSAETLADIGVSEEMIWIAALPRWMILGATALVYFCIFLLWSALTHTFVTMPVMRHYARGLVLHDPEKLDTIRQRDRDEVQQAEGFAEALDVGASI